MRWLMLLASILGFGLAFSTKSPGLLALGLVLGFGLMFGALLGFAAARIEQTSRPDATMLTDKDINALKASLRKPGAPAAEARAPGRDQRPG